MAFRVMINYLLSVGVPVAFRVKINYLLSVGVPVALTIDVCRVKKNRKRPERDTLRMEMFLIKVQAEKDNALVIMLRNESSQMVKKMGSSRSLPQRLCKGPLNCIRVSF